MRRRNVFPATIGSINRNDYWTISLGTDNCEYYDLNTNSGVPKYTTGRNKPNQIHLKFVKRLGAGGHGLAIKVKILELAPRASGKVSSRDDVGEEEEEEEEQRERYVKTTIVLKIALDSFVSVRERTLGSFINRWMLTGRTSPNFVKSLFEFICPGLPPARGKWRRIVEEIQRDWVPGFNRSIRQGSARPGISYLGQELGTSGDIFSLADKKYGKDVVASFSFQMFFGLAALHEVDVAHGDIQDQNVVVSGFKPRDLRQVPLYRLKYYEEMVWIYADPYLSMFSSTQKNPFFLPEKKEEEEEEEEEEEKKEKTKKKKKKKKKKKLEFYYTLKFIDYGGSLQLPKHTPQVIYLDQLSGVIDSASPELLFIDRDPQELFLSERPAHPMVPYSKASDIWSVGIVMTRLILGGDHIFMDLSKKPRHGLQPWLLNPPNVVLKAMRSVYGNRASYVSMWMSQYMHSAQYIEDGIYLMWNMVEALGLPSENGKGTYEWPGITESLLLKTIMVHKEHLIYGAAGGWVRNLEKKSMPPLIYNRRELFHRVLGTEGRKLLFNNVLAWNPENRSPAFLIATQHPYFDRIRGAGDFRDKSLTYDINNIWGFQQNWWHDRKGKKALIKQTQPKKTKKKTRKKKMKKGKQKV